MQSVLAWQLGWARSIVRRPAKSRYPQLIKKTSLQEGEKNFCMLLTFANLKVVSCSFPAHSPSSESPPAGMH